MSRLSSCRLVLAPLLRRGEELMDYESFVKSVYEATDFESKKQAEAAAEATLKNLVRRITSGEGKGLADQLPAGLKEDVARAAQETERFSLDEFFNRVAHEEGVGDRSVAERHARAVAGVLAESVTRGELTDVFSQLPKEYADLFTAKDV
jgi:uncharacterized protein (DUF2267 family)